MALTTQRRSTFNALTGQSTPTAPPMQVADDNGNAARNADPFNNPTAPAPAPAPTGVGAGRGYPTNWNANNAPGLASSGEGTTFATNPTTGASYETSPMYQWQLKQGEKSINRAARARGRYNSSVGMNTLANFYNQLGAQEADKQYGRVFDQQKLGLQAALAEASARAQAGGQLGSLYGNLGGQMASGSQGYGNNLVNLLQHYATSQGNNLSGFGTAAGNAAIGQATPQSNLQLGQGADQQALYALLAKLGIGGFEAYKNPANKTT